MGKKYRIINDIIDERESVRMVNAVPFIHRPDHMALKVSDVSAAYWQHLTHNKTLQFYIIMHSYGFSQQGNPASLYISHEVYEGNFSFILILQL